MSFDGRIIQSPLGPHSVTLRARHPEVLLESLDEARTKANDDHPTFGRISSDGQWSWMAQGNVLEVSSNESPSKRVSAWRFLSHLEGSHPIVIRDVREFNSDENRICLCVAVQLDSHSIICLFDPVRGRVVKAVRCPYVVNSIEPVADFRRDFNCRPLLHPVLQFFVGVVAVGTDCGRILLVDLRLDDNIEMYWETRPSNMEQLRRFQDGESARSQSILQGNHLYLELGGDYHRQGHFHFTQPNGSVIKLVSEEDAGVTSMKFVPRINCLVVGFKFGAVQLWNLAEVDLICGICDDREDVPVVQIAFQEPEEDPKHFCYLWIARSSLNTSHFHSDLPSTLCMYHLMFSSKRDVEDFGVIYQHLKSVAPRFLYPLCRNPLAPDHFTAGGSKIISCYCLGEEDLLVQDLDKSDSQEDNKIGRVGNLMVCAWESLKMVEGEERHVSILGLFDLDRWYDCQMPHDLQISSGSPEGGSPFFTFYSLSDVVSSAEGDFLLDFSVDSSSVSWFSVPQGQVPDAVMSMPSAIQLDALALSELAIVEVKILGIQEKALVELSRLGPSVLANPSDMFNLLQLSQILPHSHPTEPSQERSCKTLLTVALEHGLLSFLISSAEALSSADVSVGGFGLSAFLEWTVETAYALKVDCDDSCLCLFDGNWKTVSETKKKWIHYAAQFKRLQLVFQSLLQQTRPTTEQGKRELEVRLNEATLVQERLETILWLVGADYLPEQPRSRPLNGGGVFQLPYQRLQNFHSDLRKDRGDLLTMVDHIVAEMGAEKIAQLWGRDFSGSGSYPPPNLYAFLNVFFIDSSSRLARISLIYYFLLDLDSQPSDLSRRPLAKQYASVFSIDEQTQKTVEGLWFIDHGQFDPGIAFLCSVRVPLFPWIPSSVLRIALQEDQPAWALHYLLNVIQPSPAKLDDLQLYLSVFLANGRVDDAFLRLRSSPDERLFNHFIDGCLSKKLGNELLQLPYTAHEESCVVSRLQESAHPLAAEFLLMYYLSRCRYAEAVRLNGELNANAMARGLSREESERAVVRNQIMTAYERVLPETQKMIVNLTKQRPVQSKDEYPKPLSVKALPVSDADRIWSKSTFLVMVSEKIEEARRCQAPPQPTATPSRSTRSIASLPFIGTPLSTRPTPRASVLTPLLSSCQDDDDDDIADEQIELVESSHNPLPVRSSVPKTPPTWSSGLSALKAKVMNRSAVAKAWTPSSLLYSTPLHREPLLEESTQLSLLLATPQSILKPGRSTLMSSRKKQLSFAPSPPPSLESESFPTSRRIRFTPLSSGAEVVTEESKGGVDSSDGEITLNFSRPAAASQQRADDATTSPSERLAKLKELKEQVTRRLDDVRLSPARVVSVSPPTSAASPSQDDDSFVSAQSELEIALKEENFTSITPPPSPRSRFIKEDVQKEKPATVPTPTGPSLVSFSSPGLPLRPVSSLVVSPTRYTFSPPTILASTTAQPPPLPEEKEEPIEFYFSPPLTRSGSRRRTFQYQKSEELLPPPSEPAASVIEPATPVRRSRRIQERADSPFYKDDVVLFASTGRRRGRGGHSGLRKGRAGQPTMDPVEAGKRLRAKLLRQRKT
eukprot:m.77590 g.77590  ORF g.77590 m.77590 type:complete len:1577 (+) comp36045_c0_seq6:82-4812(+)